jgi:hypothetical protein
MFSKNDDDKGEGKTPPKGFEKFFKKRDQRKGSTPEASGNNDEAENSEKNSENKG